MLRTLYIATVFVGYGIIIFPKYLYCRFFLKDPKQQDLYTNKVIRRWAKILYKVIGSELRITGNTHLPDGQIFVVSNHLSMMDIPALIAAVDKPIGFVAKKELEHVPLISKWIRMTGSVFIDRSDMRQSLKAIIKATDNLKEGYTLGIFPEGTRSKTGELGEFKKGSLKPALKSGVPIVPIALKNTDVLFEDLKKLKIKKPVIKIHFFDAIDPESLSLEERKTLHEDIRNEINDFYTSN